MQNKCAEIKIRAERRAGTLLKDMQERGEVADKGEQKGNSNAAKDEKRILHNETFVMEASRCKTLAEMLPLTQLDLKK